MVNVNRNFERVTMQNFREAFRNPDRIVQHGNKMYMLNTKHVIDDGFSVPKPLPKRKDYKSFNIKIM